VTRVLTGQQDDEPDVTVREARIGDRYLIASDGLTDYVAGDTIAEMVLAGETPAATADRLVALALKAGAPDNVTIVIGDVVDITKVTAPPTQPQIVGAAATRTKRGTRPIPVTPAAKAAALSREASGQSEYDDGDVTLAEEGPASGPAKWLRRVAVLGLVLIVLGGAAYAAYAWSQRQYFVADHQGNVAIYQGVSQDLGPIKLSHVESESDVVVDDLPDFERQQVQATIVKDSLADAQALLNRLRTDALRCAASRATGGACDDSSTTTPSTTPSTTTTTTTAPTTPSTTTTR
jgi:protein phosphatase